MARFDAILFDAGGVLVLPDPTVLGPLLAYYGGDPSYEAHRRAHHAGVAAKALARGLERDWMVYNRTYVEVVGCEPEHLDTAAEALRRTRNEWLWRYPIPDSVAALWALHERGVTMGVVSNASGQIEAVLATSGVCQRGEGPHVPMRCIVDSHVVGFEKPDRRVFEPALDVLGTVPERVVYVGDTASIDVVGARNAGLYPVLLDPFDHHDGHPFLSDGDDEVERIASLADLLRFDLATPAV
jgi:putative hydrolase of the HAD superfamily